MPKMMWKEKASKFLTEYLSSQPTNPDWEDLHCKMTKAGFSFTQQQIKARWNYVSKYQISKQTWERKELLLIFEGYSQFPRRWALIANNLKDRNGICVRTKFFALVKEFVYKIIREVEGRKRVSNIKKNYPLTRVFLGRIADGEIFLERDFIGAEQSKAKVINFIKEFKLFPETFLQRKSIYEKIFELIKKTKEMESTKESGSSLYYKTEAASLNSSKEKKRKKIKKTIGRDTDKTVDIEFNIKLYKTIREKFAKVRKELATKSNLGENNPSYVALFAEMKELYRKMEEVFSVKEDLLIKEDLPLKEEKYIEEVSSKEDTLSFPFNISRIGSPVKPFISYEQGSLWDAEFVERELEVGNLNLSVLGDTSSFGFGNKGEDYLEEESKVKYRINTSDSGEMMNVY